MTTASLEVHNSQLETVQELLRGITGYWVSVCIYSVAKLGIADLLNDQPVALATLARQAGAHEDYLYRVMRALSGIGIFRELEGQRFEQTPLSHMLRSDVPGSMRGVAMMMGEEHYHAWGHLLESLKAGDRPFEAVYGMPVFEYFQKNPEAGEIFNSAMTGFASNVHRAVVSTYDFARFNTLADIGGGHGALLAAILAQYPHLKGVLFDLPHVVQGAIFPETLNDRVKIAGGDFFQAVYPGADAYILSTVIHDWEDTLALKILKNIHAAMPEKGTLLLVEHVVESDNQPSPAKFLDINMLVMTEGGRERSSQAYRKLYEDAGFELSGIIPTPSGVSVIEGIKR